MVQFTTFAIIATAALAAASPIRLQRRIAQVIAESTADWQDACLAAGGAQQCNPISQTAFSSLLAAGGNCDQQDAADLMVDLAKTLGNDPEMIRLAQLFVQQPRNTPEGTQTPYCGVAPQNAELNGLFHCQFAGSVNRDFSGNGQDNLPLGVAAVNPVGSCPASPNGPVPDGVQLNTLVQNPRAAGGAVAAPAPQAPAPVVAQPVNNGAVVQPPPVVAAPANNAGAAAGGVAPAGAKPFTLANGQKALAENASFAALSANSACTAGQTACVDGGFAQCVAGRFAITPCAGGTQCFSLPLVNSAGTSLTCSTEADKDARIAATGAA